MKLASPYFYFDSQILYPLAEKYKLDFSMGQPFRHVVIDNFLPEEVLETVLDEFPKADQIDWVGFHRTDENKKLTNEDETQMGQFTRHLLAQFNSSIFTKFLENLTGIEGLIPDPHFRGGGLHQIEKGGHLGIHCDFNVYKKLNLDRRLNVLIYLNKNWKNEYGGHLELWDKNMTKAVAKISPIFNRFVVFATDDFSYHGHPDPLQCPDNETRKSLAFYYYSNGRPAHEVSQSHSTLFQKRPGLDKPVKINTKSLIKKFLPPIILDLVRWVKSKTK